MLTCVDHCHWRGHRQINFVWMNLLLVRLKSLEEFYVHQGWQCLTGPMNKI